MAIKTNSKQFLESIRGYIVECITNDNEILEDALQELFEQVQANRIEGYYTNGNAKKMTIYAAVEKTLRGIYKAFEFSTYEIELLMQDWTQHEANEKTEDLYYNLLSREIVKMFDKAGFNIY